ncbi:MAG: hypothetical protein N0A24_01320 [Armatimonadetes bacterium]|nr:hypothetical protein [Armatimonadota bacterium]MDW8152858.1 hypothetical protein [Armatimonadota bacterium]
MLAFVASGGLIVLAGVAIAWYSETIAETTGLGRMWVGAVLLAGATSLPELTTDIFAVRLDAVDLAVGDLFGSSMANMLILAVLDLLFPRKEVLRRATLDHVLTVSLAILLTALATVFVLARPELLVFWIDLASLLLFLVYLAGARAIHHHVRYQSARTELYAPGWQVETQLVLRRAVVGWTLAAIGLLGVAPVFVWSAHGIAEITGLGDTFIGTWLVGLTTSMPELVTSIVAVRMGAVDLAIGNLFGSNAFNMALFLPLDLVQPASLFAAADPDHVLSGLVGITLMSLGLVAVVYRAERRFLLLEWGSLLMLAAYGLGVWLLYRVR